MGLLLRESSFDGGAVKSGIAGGRVLAGDNLVTGTGVAGGLFSTTTGEANLPSGLISAGGAGGAPNGSGISAGSGGKGSSDDNDGGSTTGPASLGSESVVRVHPTNNIARTATAGKIREENILIRM